MDIYTISKKKKFMSLIPGWFTFFWLLSKLYVLYTIIKLPQRSFRRRSINRQKIFTYSQYFSALIFGSCCGIIFCFKKRKYLFFKKISRMLICVCSDLFHFLLYIQKALSFSSTKIQDIKNIFLFWVFLRF